MKRNITIIALLTLLITSLQAQIIDATNNTPKKKEKTSSISPIYKPTGHYLRFEAGFPHYASIAYGYQLSPYVLIGGGIGFGRMHYFETIWKHYPDGSVTLVEEHDRIWNYHGIPLFIETIISTPKHKWSLMLDLKLGYGIPIDEHHFYNDPSSPFVNYTTREHLIKGKRFFGSVNLGASYKNISLFIGISSNNRDWFSLFVSYNLPLKVH